MHPMPIWNCLHLYAGEDGVSRVDASLTRELTEVQFAPPAPSLFVKKESGAQALVLMELPIGWKGGWHASPKEQWVICLNGEMGYQAGDGTEFKLQPGSCILTTDTHGQGHNSWNAGEEPVRLAIVQIE